MLTTTTNTLEGYDIQAYQGLVMGETILGAKLFKDLFASVRDRVGGRSEAYEKTLVEAREVAILEMCEKAKKLGTNAVIGVSLDDETVGGTGSMLMVTATGTAIAAHKRCHPALSS